MSADEGSSPDGEGARNDALLSSLPSIPMRTSTCRRGVHKQTRIPDFIPADLDESANQEPPSRNCVSHWLTHDSNLTHLTQDYSNSCSSGYFSSSTSHSAPLFFKNRPDEELENCDSTSSHRTQSCINHCWLSTRRRKTQNKKIMSNSRPASPDQIRDLSASKNNVSPVRKSNSENSVESVGFPKQMDDIVSDVNVSFKDCSTYITQLSESKKRRLDLDLIESSERDHDCTQTTDDSAEGSFLGYSSDHEPRRFGRRHSTPLGDFQSARPLRPNSASDLKHSELNMSRSSTASSMNIELDSSKNVADESIGCHPTILPVLRRTDTGLHCVSVHTVAQLVSGKSGQDISYIIIDCRYPYEYGGGHIRGALNFYMHSDVLHEILNRVPALRPADKPGPPKLLGSNLIRRLIMKPREPVFAPYDPLPVGDDDDSDDDLEQYTSEASEIELAAAAAEQQASSITSDNFDEQLLKPNLSDSTTSNHPAFVVIFHCEFSSQRAPDLAAFLRTIDRTSNYHRYPFLYFPEVYVMSGGYSSFFHHYSSFCTPEDYIKMSHRDYRAHFRLYRRLTKRVSSACAGCIRPQHKLLNQPGKNPLDSFEIAKPTESALQTTPRKRPTLILPHDEQLMLSLIDESDKENKLQHLDRSDENNDEHKIVSPSAGLSSDEDSDSSGDCLLDLVEKVVRVGHRVTLSTLSTADPSLGFTSLLDRINEHWPVSDEASDNLSSLDNLPKLSRTSTRLSGSGLWRHPFRSILNDSFESLDSHGMHSTPDNTKFRKRTPMHFRELFGSIEEDQSGNTTAIEVCQQFSEATTADTTFPRRFHSSPSPSSPSP